MDIDGVVEWRFDGSKLINGDRAVIVDEDCDRLEAGSTYYGPADPDILIGRRDTMAFEPDDDGADEQTQTDEQENEEVLFDGDEGDTPDGNQNVESLGMDDVLGNDYFDLGKGDTIGVDVEEIRRNHDVKYSLSDQDYAIEVVDTDGKILSVTAWKLWGLIRQAYREAHSSDKIGEDLAGLQLRITRGDEDGEYDVAWRAGPNDDFHEVERDE